MARYIDADKIHEFVDAKVAEGKDGWAKGVPYEWSYALTVIDMQPTADVAPKSEVEKAIQDGIRAFCEELVAEITADRDRAYDSITERNRRKESHLNDAFCIHEDGKLVALNGMLYSVNALLKKYTEGQI